MSPLFGRTSLVWLYGLAREAPSGPRLRGHGTYEMTQKYIHLTDEDRMAAAAASVRMKHGNRLMPRLQRKVPVRRM